MIIPPLLLLAFLWMILAAGVSVLVAVRFRPRYWADLVLAAFGAGMASLGLLVFASLLANVYSLPFAALLAAAPTAFLVWRRRDIAALAPADPHWKGGLAMGLADGVAATACLPLLLVAFVHAVTSPMDAWDAVVSWDKWATEWAQRANLYDRKLAYYPQLLPMVSSILYRLTGTAAEPLPLTQFALHAFQSCLGGVALIAALRLAGVLRIAAWPVLLAMFGCFTFRSHLTDGSADLLAATTLAVALTLFLAALRDDLVLPSRSAAILFGLVFFGAFFTKSHNLVLLLPLALYSIAARRVPGIGLALAGALLGFGAFAAQQYASSGLPDEKLNIQELNFEQSRVLQRLSHAAESTLKADAEASRLQRVAELVVQNYMIPARHLYPAAAVAIVLILAGLRTPLVWPLLLTALLQLLIWYRFTSYDLRNLLPSLLPLGVAVSAGMGSLLRIRLSRGAVRWIAVAAAIPAAVFVLYDLSTRSFQSMLTGLLELPRRQSAIEAGFAARAAYFFPREYAAYEFINGLRPLRRAPHLMIGSRMYRWFPNGAYPISSWPKSSLVPGDAYVTMPPDLLKRPEDWTLVFDDAYQRIYFWNKDPKILTPQDLTLAGPSAPKAGAAPGEYESTGPGGLIVYNLPVRDLRAGDSVTWRVIAESCAPLSPAYSAYDPAIIDSRLTRAVTDTRTPTAYSGILTFSGAPVSPDAARDPILIGVAANQPGTRVRIREFRIAIQREP